MKKKLISSALAFTVFFGTVSAGLVTATGQVHAATFTDTNDHWAKTYIDKAVNAGIVNGYPDGTFLPDAPVKRSEFTRMINNALGNTSTANISFTDVPSYEWYYNDVAKAISAGYAGGYDTGDFKPDSYISRQEAAVMLSRIVPTSDYSTNLKAYPDYANISDWAETSLSRIVGKKYMGAYDDGNVHPLDYLTRAQAAKILYDIVEKEKIVKTTLTVKEADTELTNRIYSNGVTINKDVADGAVKFDNCVVLGSLYVQGGGSGSDCITVVDSRIANLQVSKSASAVKIVAKDDTRILDTSVWKETLLETTSLDGGLFGTGFDRINVYGSSDVTLDGNFPAVDIKGTGAKLNFDAGTITKLTVDSAGKNSEIVSGSYGTIDTADVNGAVQFKGEGTIKTLNANVSGISYETKPKTINTKSGVTGPTYSDASLTISPTPAKGATGIDVTSDITLSFASAIKKYSGSTLSDDDLESIVELRKGSSSGTKVSFTASINSTKKKVTVSPDSSLDYGTKYYVIIKANTLKDADGNGNEAFSTYFTTEAEETADISISPKNKATNVGVSDNITITFASAMRMRDDSAITSSKVKDIVELRKGSSSGTKVSFTGTINSSKKVITIDPSSNLEYNTKYYVIINKNAIENSSGNGNAAFSSYFTTADYAFKISSITASSNEDSITATVTPSQNGTLYSVLLAKGTKAPSADQIVAGQDGNGNSALRNGGSVSVTKNTAKTLTAFRDLTPETEYVLYCVLKSGTTVSPVASKNVTTAKKAVPDAALTGLSVVSAKGMSPAFNASTKSYDVLMQHATDSVSVNATAASGVTVLYSTDGSSWSTDALVDVPVSGSTLNKLYVKAQESGKLDVVYTLNIEVEGKPQMTSVVVKVNGVNASGNAADTLFTVPAGTTVVDVAISALDPYATVTCSKLSGATLSNGVLTGQLTLDTTSDTTEASYVIKSNLDTANYSFTVMVLADDPTPPVTSPPSITP